MKYIQTLFSGIWVQIMPKLTRNQNARPFARKNGSQSLLPWCVTSHKDLIYILRLKVRQVPSWDIAMPDFAIFSFVMLCYSFCDVCSYMLTCVFCILFEIFSKDQNYQKCHRLELSVLLLLTKTNPDRVTEPLMPLSDSYIPSLYPNLFWLIYSS